MKDGDKYMPSNGTEGMCFEEDHCLQCINCDPNPSGKKQCNIWFNAINNWPTGIKEWIYRNGNPTCTSFVKWDWGNDGDPDDPNNPKAPPPPTPINQINLFPLYPNETHYMELKDFKKLKIGDEVVVTKSVKDGYGEIWHEKGDVAKIKSFTSDGVGVMFEWSDLGTHHKNIDHKKTPITNAIIRGIKKLNF